MKKIIGGLLVISLMSKPSLLKIDYIAYEIYKASGQIIRSIRNYTDEIEKKIDSADVDAVFADVDKNAKGISGLLSDLHCIIAKINSVMQIKAAAKGELSDIQIDRFREFTEFYNSETGALNQTLALISDKMELKAAKMEIMRNDTDCSVIYNELSAISDCQYEAIYSISSIISHAEQTLSFIA